MANDSKTWRCGKYELSFDRPRIMGVLNVTPDSFSDGGEHFDPDAAIEYGLAMLDAGATSSTWAASPRVLALPRSTPTRSSPRAARGTRAGQRGCHRLDRHAPRGGCQAAVRCGASIVNDVTGFTDQDGRVCRDEHLRRHRDACR